MTNFINIGLYYEIKNVYLYIENQHDESLENPPERHCTVYIIKKKKFLRFSMLVYPFTAFVI